MAKPTDLEGRFDKAMKKGEKQDKTSTANTPKHKAMKSLYKEGVKNVGADKARELAGKGFNRLTRRGTSDGYMTNAKKLTVKSEDKENKIKINKK